MPNPNVLTQTRSTNPALRAPAPAMTALPTALIDDAAALAPAWGRAVQRIGHHLHDSPLFGMDALAALIERYPPEGYALVLTNRSADGGTRRWREGLVQGASGLQVLQAIAEGSMWLNLRAVNHHAPEFEPLLQQLYGELRAAIPGFDPQALKMGILVSSPRIQVHYHADLPGQGLWQIAGRKRVWVYPAQPPYLPQQALEDIALTGVEFKLPYRSDFDAAAEVIDLAPGQALNWPLNAPHRIDNHDCLNISVTTEYWTPANRRSQQVHLANAVLRRMGLPAGGRQLSGPVYVAKAGLQALWRRSPWASRTRSLQRPLDFRLDPSAPGGFVDIAPVYR